MNTRLTDERIAHRIAEIEAVRSASRDFWDGDYEYPENIELMVLREIQQYRKAQRVPVGYMVGTTMLENMTQAIACKANSQRQIQPLYIAPSPAAELDPAVLINKFYERYPLNTFKSDSARAEALGCFMAGAELQCYGDFIAYEDSNIDE